MSKKILTGPDIFTNNQELPFIKSGAILIDNDTIIDVGKYQELKNNNPDVYVQNISDGLLTLGLVNLQHLL